MCRDTFRIFQGFEGCITLVRAAACRSVVNQFENQLRVKALQMDCYSELASVAKVSGTFSLDSWSCWVEDGDRSMQVFGTDKHPVTGHFGVPWSTSFYPYLNPNDACHSAGFSQISVCLLHTVRAMKKFNDSEKFLIARGKPVSQRKADFTCWRQTPRSPTPQEHTQMISNDIIYLSSEDEWTHWLYAAILTLGF